MKTLLLMITVALTATSLVLSQTNHSNGGNQMIYGQVLHFDPNKTLTIKTDNGEKKFKITKDTVLRMTNGLEMKQFTLEEKSWVNILTTNSPDGSKIIRIQPGIEDVGGPDYVPRPTGTNHSDKPGVKTPGDSKKGPGE